MSDNASEGFSVSPTAYTPGTFHDVPGFTLGNAVNVVSYREVIPAYSYDRPKPELIDAGECEAEVLAEFARQSTKHASGAPVWEVVLRDVVVFGSAVYERHGSQLRAIWETCRENDRTARRQPTASDLATIRTAQVGDYLLLTSPGSSNYGHWLVDDLCRMAATLTLGPSTCLLMGNHGELMNQRRRQGLQLLLGTRAPKIGLLSHTSAYHFVNLRLVTPVSYHPALKCPGALAALRSGFARSVLVGQNKRVALLRGRQVGRGLTNSDEIFGALKNAGFVFVDPMVADAAEQASACFGAEIVVGIMGAAMANTLFCAKGTKVVHLVPRGWVEPFYWDLASACSHRYTAVFGESFGPEQPWRRNFQISVRALLAALSLADD